MYCCCVLSRFLCIVCVQCTHAPKLYHPTQKIYILIAPKRRERKKASERMNKQTKRGNIRKGRTVTQHQHSETKGEGHSV